MRILAVAIGIGVFLVDYFTKKWVTASPWVWGYDVVEGLFRIRYVTNEGIAFGLFHNLDSEWKPLVLSGLALVALALVAFYILTAPSRDRLLLVALGLLLGGILGNFVDRLVHQHVVDFLELHWRDRLHWPTFNVADASITCGVLLVLIETFRRKEPQEVQEKEAASN